MSVRMEPQVGMRVVMPVGIAEVVEIDNQQDRAAIRVAGDSVYVDYENLYAFTPDSREPATIEDWLNGPELMLIQSQTVPCRICPHCERLVVLRGYSITESHQKRSALCMCDPGCPCCATDVEPSRLAKP